MSIEFLQAADTAEIAAIFPPAEAERAAAMFKQVVSTRLGIYITAAAQAIDPDFRVGLFTGALSVADFDAEEEAYVAVGLTMAEDEDEKERMYQAFLAKDRFMYPGLHGKATFNYVAIEHKIDQTAEISTSELLASDEVVWNSVGRAQQAMKVHQGVRVAERAITAFINGVNEGDQ